MHRVFDDTQTMVAPNIRYRYPLSWINPDDNDAGSRTIGDTPGTLPLNFLSLGGRSGGTAAESRVARISVTIFQHLSQNVTTARWIFTRARYLTSMDTTALRRTISRRAMKYRDPRRRDRLSERIAPCQRYFRPFGHP